MAENQKQILQRAYLDFLKEEGYSPKIEDGDISFKYQGTKYWIDTYEDEIEFFTLYYVIGWDCETEDEKSKLYVAAAKTNSEMKVAKTVIVNEETVLFEIEALMEQPSELKKHFERMLIIIQSAVETFKENMAE
jgi:KaiC/GvpD/RAD55 family RecA-like ATPase